MTIGRQLFSFALGLILLVFAAWLAVQVRSGAFDRLLAAPQLTIAPATAPAPAVRPFSAAPAPQPASSAPAEWHPPLVAPPPQAQPAQPYGAAPEDEAAPAEAVPAGAPMTEDYKATIQSQQRTNDKGEFCAPRSGCTKPGSGGALPGPVGEQP